MTIAGVLEREFEVPEKVQLSIDNGKISAKGPKGTLVREFDLRRIKVVKKEGRKWAVMCEYPRIKDKAMIGTIESHVLNMIHGVTNGYEYKMKIVYSHFPIKATAKGTQVIIENFLGERHPRKTRIVGETKVTIKGDEVTLQGTNIEAVGQTAANIEQACKIKRLDPRVFQDGIYITHKGWRDEQ
ncbi:MAG TPA: 50S ribosomal protein L6 [Thermoplasmata archaeon]|nr:50S ribosomal protein L6 [Thermoplasmata archaeon]